MKPPSDALRHTLQKLAEVRANRNNTSAAAPPPYTLSVSRPSGTNVMNLDQSDPADYYYPEEPAPINITIDNSVAVTGNDNTIVLPESGVQPPITPTGSTGSTGSTGENRTSPPVGSVAAIIVAALNRANALRDESGVLRPINIQINSGIRVDGQNNVISRGADLKPKPEHVDIGPEANSPLKRRANSEPIGTPPAARRRMS